jgi:RHS repeat-associated protein
VRTVKYTYYVTGDASNITVKDEWTGQGDPPADYSYYYDLALSYTEDHKLWRALWDKWTIDGEGQPADYTKLAAREFYYDLGRQRYLDRDVDPDTWQLIGSGRWTDYQGEQPYADFTHSGGYQEVPTEQTSYFAGHAQQTVSTGDTAYRHGDLIGSTMLTTDDSGTAASAVSYTAFGEPITAGGVGVPPANFGTRYQYAGAHGYESGLLTLQGPNTELAPISLQHVGARWYQPDIGRFVQRDPIGLGGGANVYLYCSASPLVNADPAGLDPEGLIEVICPSVDTSTASAQIRGAQVKGAARTRSQRIRGGRIIRA